MKRYVSMAALLLLLIVCFPQVGEPQGPATGAIALTTLADVTGDGSAHAVSSAIPVRWVLFVSSSTNASEIRVGDSSITSSRGAIILAGGGLLLPPMPQAPKMDTKDQYYDLSKIYYLAQTGDKLSIMWGK